MSKIITKWITDDAVTREKINADVAGNGLTQAAGGELDINADGTTVEVATDTLRVVTGGIDTLQLAATSVTAAKLGSDVAGDGLTGGNGADLDVQPDTTGGANLAKVVNVSANGVAIKIDDDTIGEDGSNRLYVKANSIGPTEVDETANYTWTGSQDFTGSSATVGTPSGDNDVVNKAYADALRNGLTWKDPVKAMSTTDEDPGTGGLPTNIDGVTSWSDGDRVLLTNQSTGAENGIWEVHAGAWTRPDDFDTGGHAAGAITVIEQGATYGDTKFLCTTNPPSDVIDTNALVWTQDSTGTAVTAGIGLTKTGNTIDIGASGGTGDINGINRTATQIGVATDGATLEVASNLVQIRNLGVTEAKLAATCVTAAKLGSDVAGDGLTGGNGTDLDVQADATGGANLAKVVNVSANGVAVKIDNTSVGENGSGQLEVKVDGVDRTRINADVAGDGIAQATGGELNLDINGLAYTETSVADTDLLAIYEQDDGRTEKITFANFKSALPTGESVYQEMHTISSGEVTAGYFTLSNSPINVRSVRLFAFRGIIQVNKDALDGTGVTPDFQLLSTNQLHFNNNGAATGLSEDLESGDTVFVVYNY